MQSLAWVESIQGAHPGLFGKIVVVVDFIVVVVVVGQSDVQPFVYISQLQSSPYFVWHPQHDLGVHERVVVVGVTQCPSEHILPDV